MAEARRGTREASDVGPLGIAIGAGVVVGAIALAVTAPWGLLVLVPTPARAPNNAPAFAVRGPLLQTAPHDDLEAFLRAKRGRLESYGVDRASGRGHIPIERAMEEMVWKDRLAGAPG